MYISACWLNLAVVQVFMVIEHWMLNAAIDFFCEQELIDSFAIKGPSSRRGPTLSIKNRSIDMEISACWLDFSVELGHDVIYRPWPNTCAAHVTEKFNVYIPNNTSLPSFRNTWLNIYSHVFLAGVRWNPLQWMSNLTMLLLPICSWVVSSHPVLSFPIWPDAVELFPVVSCLSSGRHIRLLCKTFKLNKKALCLISLHVLQILWLMVLIHCLI